MAVHRLNDNVTAGRGCSAATVRIWKTAEEPPVEICGEKLNDGFEHYLSDGTSMKIA